MRPRMDSQKETRRRPNRLAANMPVISRMKMPTMTPKPGMENPKTFSGRHSGGINKMVRSIRVISTLITNTVAARGSQTSRPAIRYLRRFAMLQSVWLINRWPLFRSFSPPVHFQCRLFLFWTYPVPWQKFLRIVCYHLPVWPCPWACP